MELVSHVRIQHRDDVDLGRNAKPQLILICRIEDLNSKDMIAVAYSVGE